MLLSVLRGIGSAQRSAGGAGVRAVEALPEAPVDTLVGRVLEGDRRAAAQLYQRHLPYLLGMAVRMLRSRAEGEDVVQDAFAIAFERLSTLRDPTAFKSWAAQITVSLVRKRIRRQRVFGSLFGVGHGQGHGEDATLELLAGPSSNGETRAELSLVAAVLVALPAEQRLAWMLRYVEGEELESVATLSGCSLATAKRRIAAASRRMNEHVAIEEDA